MTVSGGRVLPGKEVNLYDYNFVHFKYENTDEISKNTFAWGIQSTAYTGTFTMAEMCFCATEDYYVRESSIPSTHGITAVEYYSNYLYIGGSLSFGSNIFSPVFGYGEKWIFKARRIDKLESPGEYENYSIDRIYIQRMPSPSNLVYYMAR